VLVKVIVCEADAALIAVDGKVRPAGVMLTETVAPVPLNATVCGELAELSTKLSAAVSAPVVEGLKVTVTVQEALAVSVDPQVLVCVNDDALAPVMLTPVTVMLPVPELVRVTACVADEEPTVVEAKLMLVAERVATGVFAANPVPLSATVCGELAALSAKLSVAVSAPVAAGLKVTVTAQEALTASVALQVLVCVNDVGLVPPMLTPVTVMEALPELVSVTDCVADEELIAVEEKVRLVVERVVAGAGDVVAVPGQPFTTLATLSEPRPVALSYPAVAA
jgi:uncharacterized protein YaaW (UPF0174 family)